MQTKGLFWHVHHDVLVEYCWNVRERIAHIKENKPVGEQALRLSLLMPVRNVPVKLKAACAAYDKAQVACGKTSAACDKAGAAYDKARVALDKALEEAMPELEVLHRKQCPDCPWNGKTIFPKKG